MEIAAIVLSSVATVISVGTAIWVYKAQARDQRMASTLNWRRTVFSHVAESLWGLTELKDTKLATQHKEENLAAVRALNVASFVFSDTDASDAIENYRRNADVENAIEAIGAMAKVCGVNFPEKRADRSSVFGPTPTKRSD